MEGASICCRCWSQARWAGPTALTGGPLMCNVLTDFEVGVTSRQCHFTLPSKLRSLWHNCISLVDDKWSYHLIQTTKSQFWNKSIHESVSLKESMLHLKKRYQCARHTLMLPTISATAVCLQPFLCSCVAYLYIVFIQSGFVFHFALTIPIPH